MQHQNHHNPARYTRFVQIMRVMLPLLALSIIALLILWPQIDPTNHITSASKEAQKNNRITYRDLKQNRLLEARYEGIDEKGRPFSIESDEARQNPDNPDHVVMIHPKASLKTDEKTFIKLRAQQGDYRQEDRLLLLSRDVVLTFQTLNDDPAQNTLVKADDLTLLAKESRAHTENPIYIEGPDGRMDAAGLSIIDAGGRIVFKGPAVAHINIDGEEAGLTP